MRDQKFRKLDVWIKAMEMVEDVYFSVRKFPPYEMYGLTGQLRRAALSIPLNIAEGCGAGSDAEFKRFVMIAGRSAYELMCGIGIAARLGYCTTDDRDRVLKKGDELCAMLSGLGKRLKSAS